MTDPEKNPGASAVANTESRVKFDYLKSHLFRTVHADGVIGGPTPDSRKLYMALYSERAPIPTQVTHELKAIGQEMLQLGEEVSELRISRDAVVRELEVGVVMDLASAAILHKWLGEKLGLLNKLNAQKGEAAKALKVEEKP